VKLSRSIFTFGVFATLTGLGATTFLMAVFVTLATALGATGFAVTVLLMAGFTAVVGATTGLIACAVVAFGATGFNAVGLAGFLFVMTISLINYINSLYRLI
jgi:hypothetical protein